LMPEAFFTTSLFGSPTFRVERKENTQTKERFHQFWPLISQHTAIQWSLSSHNLSQLIE
jgi:hypothetical protein